MVLLIAALGGLFLSTLSLRRATAQAHGGAQQWKFLSTLSLRRATWLIAAQGIAEYVFLSTLSLRRATPKVLYSCNKSAISIHALLAESDLLRHRSPADCLDFYPRSPCGERPGRWAGRLLQVQFLSTLSLRRATERGNHNQVGWQISIHALLAESDLFGLGTPSILPQFLSTLSLRRATSNFCTKTKQDLQFLSTLSLRRATRIRPVFSRRCRYFYPRSPCGERPFDA